MRTIKYIIHNKQNIQMQQASQTNNNQIFHELLSSELNNFNNGYYNKNYVSPQNSIDIDSTKTSKPRKVLVLGRTGVGKSTLINNITGQELATVGDFRKKSGMGRITIKTETFDVSYNENDYIFYDTPGYFDSLINSENRVQLHLEKLMKEVKEVDVILLCIEARKGGFHHLDLNAIKLYSSIFSPLWNRTLIIQTKTNTLDEFNSENTLKIPNCDHSIDLFAYDNSNKGWINELFVKITNINLDEYNVVIEWEKLFGLQIVKHVQQFMIDNNYYPSLISIKDKTPDNIAEDNNIKKYRNIFIIIGLLYLGYLVLTFIFGFRFIGIVYSILVPAVTCLICSYPLDRLVLTVICYVIYLIVDLTIGAEHVVIPFLCCFVLPVLCFMLIFYADKFANLIKYSNMVNNKLQFFMDFIDNITLMYENQYVEIATGQKLNYRWKGDEKLRLIKKNISKTMINDQQHVISQEKILYENGKVFFEGYMYNNVFDEGTFYFENGDIMYKGKV